MNNLAIDIFPANGFRGIGPLGLEGLSASSAGAIFSSILSLIIGVMTIVAFIWFLFLIFIGGYGIMTAGGDKQAVESARKKLSSGFIGLLIVIAGIFIFRLVGYIFGIDNISNPGELIRQISN